MNSNVNDTNFDAEVLQSDRPVLVDFFAPWCGPCQAMSPIVDDLANRYEDKVRVVKINIDESPATAREYQVQSIPSFILFDQGKIEERRTGVVPTDQLEAILDRRLESSAA